MVQWEFVEHIMSYASFLETAEALGPTLSNRIVLDIIGSTGWERFWLVMRDLFCSAILH